jgi:DNA polymerase-3 subunit alpha
MAFTQLHCHCHHSTLDGLGSPQVWVEAAKRKGFQALGITDHGSVSAAFEFYKAAKAAGIVPVIGCEFYVTDDPAYRPAKTDPKMVRYHLIVFAKNWTGLKSIFKQLTLANEQMYYRPLLSVDQIYDFKDCVITTACCGGIISHPEAAKIVALLKHTYNDDLYVEIQPHWIEAQFPANRRAVAMSKMLGIKPVVANDAHYPNAEDADTHDVLLSIQTNAKLSDPERFSFLKSGMDSLYLRTQSEMIQAFKPWVKAGHFDLEFLCAAFESTQEIVDKCSGLEMPALGYALPPLPSPEIENERAHLAKLCMDGWKAKIAGNGLDEKAYLTRLKHELAVVSKIGAIRYFLLGWDVIDYAKRKGILCGFGRGSVGGSLIAYLLGIVALDPIKYDLYFERFLREDRIDMPDIDFDFSGTDRDEIIKYVKTQYGTENVCQISTTGLLHGKSAFRDVARVFGTPITQVNEISKAIDNDESLEENFTHGSLAEFAAAYPDLVRHAVRLDGQLRSKGTHAGGIVLSKDGFSNRGVLEKRKDAVVINWNMQEAEHFGLLKFDFLALNTLSVLNDVARMVKERTGRIIDYFAIDPGDKAVLKQYSEGHTMGLFQFEAAGITGLCKKLSPITTFETVVQINALFRPGPLDAGMVDRYVARYHGKEAVEYHHPKETNITEQTLGLPLFQEQVMRLFVDLGGFTWPEADSMRKIIAKSKGETLLEEKRVTFTEGCEKAGISPTTANEIYDGIVKFGRYGFNRSHSTSYSFISFLTAWAKYYFPVEFMAALLRSVTAEAETTERYIAEAERLGVKIEGPNINISESNWTIFGDRVFAGFASMKGIGDAAAKKIAAARGKIPFSSFDDFLARTDRRTINKRVVEAIAYAGGFVSLLPNTKWIVDHYPILAAGKTPDVGPDRYPDYDEAEKHSQRAEFAPGVFSASSIEITAKMEIDDDIITLVSGEQQACIACPLASKATPPVPWKWSSRSKVLMLGQFPNNAESSVGTPFSGRSYTKMWEILKEVAGLTPGKVFQAHMFACQPPTGRLSTEIMETCTCPNLWLPKIVAATSPSVILAFGNAAVAVFTGKTSGIMKLNATSFWSAKYRAMVVFCITPGMMAFDDSGEKEGLFRTAIQKLTNYI